jgi:hypothetical protein
MRLKALAKPTFGMSLGVIQTCFQHRKLYFFGNRKRASPPSEDRGDVPKTRQPYDPSDLIIGL